MWHSARNIASRVDIRGGRRIFSTLNSCALMTLFPKVDLPGTKTLRLSVMPLPPPDSGTLPSVASVISAFGAAMLFFRVQREFTTHEHSEPTWIPCAHWLLFVATLFSLLLVIIPLLISILTVLHSRRCPRPHAGRRGVRRGYPSAILAHYRFIFTGDKPAGDRVQSRRNVGSSKLRSTWPLQPFSWATRFDFSATV